MSQSLPIMDASLLSAPMTPKDSNVDCDPVKNMKAGSGKSIRSLALPWACMVVVSIIAAVVLYPTDDDDETSYTASMGWYSDTVSTITTTGTGSTNPIMKRFLESGGGMHREHVHKHVFEEAHKPLMPLDNSDQIGFVFTVLGLMIAAGGGIGGGGILVPIYILIMGFTPKHAIPLSNITVLGGALANMFLNLKKRHPLADRPL